MDDVQNNPGAIIEAVANALGLNPEDVSLDEIFETEDGIYVGARVPKSVEVPKTFAENVSEVLKNAGKEFADVVATDSGKSVFFSL